MKIIFLSPENKLLDALITDNESIGFAKLVEVVGMNLETIKNHSPSFVQPKTVYFETKISEVLIIYQKINILVG